VTKKNNTKKDIVRSIAEQIDLPQLRTKELVQKTFDALIETLVRDRRIELRNFGVFQIKERKARMARNPRTGAKVPVQAKHVVTFKPGKEMEERVRQLDALRDDGKASGEAAPPAGGAVAPPQPAAGVAGGGAHSGGAHSGGANGGQ
jgi:nucleoid DNA-binding protein